MLMIETKTPIRCGENIFPTGSVLLVDDLAAYNLVELGAAHYVYCRNPQSGNVQAISVVGEGHITVQDICH